MAVPEDDRAITNTRQHALLARLRRRREALDVRERRPVHVQHAVELDLRLQRVQPALVGADARRDLGEGRDHFGTIERRLTEPALPVSADPGRSL